jgi:NAD(P)-dependent dehydrogenase (short-subunit alcohol dehydrogenase family)
MTTTAATGGLTARQRPGGRLHGRVALATGGVRRRRGDHLERHGRLDILVNNTGITVDKSALKMTPHDWNEVPSVNLSGAFYLSKVALQSMLGRGSGRIVDISSTVGLPAMSGRQTTRRPSRGCPA